MMRHFLTEQRNARVNLLHVHEHLRAQTNLVECLPIPTNRQFIRRAAGDVFVGKMGKTLFGQWFEISQAYRSRVRVIRFGPPVTQSGVSLSAASSLRRRRCSRRPIAVSIFVGSISQFQSQTEGVIFTRR
jgi:hypothetical protein